MASDVFACLTLFLIGGFVLVLEGSSMAVSSSTQQAGRAVLVETVNENSRYVVSFGYGYKEPSLNLIRSEPKNSACKI